MPDLARFTRCVLEERLLATVTRDAELAETTDIRVTPTIVIDGTLVPGALTEAELEKWINGKRR